MAAAQPQPYASIFDQPALQAAKAATAAAVAPVKWRYATACTACLATSCSSGDFSLLCGKAIPPVRGARDGMRADAVVAAGTCSAAGAGNAATPAGCGAAAAAAKATTAADPEVYRAPCHDHPDALP